MWLFHLIITDLGQDHGALEKVNVVSVNTIQITAVQQ